ncbi:MAG TPA: hypothetical protein VGB91_17255 [Rhizomicrobium sp.]
MRFAALLAAGAAMLLGACAYDHHGDRVVAGIDYYDGYYDGYYGAFDDGYWGTDGAFYYSDTHDHSWHRDDAHHFRHDGAGGFNHVHGRGGPVVSGMVNHPGDGGRN